MDKRDIADILKNAIGAVDRYFGGDFLPYYIRTVFGRRENNDILSRATFLAKRFKSFITQLEQLQKSKHLDLLKMDDLEKTTMRVLQRIIDINTQIVDPTDTMEKLKQYCRDHKIQNIDEITDFVHRNSEPINAAVMDLLEQKFQERQNLMNIIGVHSEFIKFLTRDYTKVKSLQEYNNKFKNLVGRTVINLVDSDTEKYGDIVKITVDDYDKEAARMKNRWKVSTGIDKFDYILNGGFEGGRVYLFAGGSGGGKSLFLINLAMRGLLELCLWPDQQKLRGILYVTLENSYEETRSRFICCTSRASRYEILGYKDNVTHGAQVKQRYMEYMKVTDGINFYTVWRPAKSISTVDIIRFVKEAEAKNGTKIEMVIIDYLDKLLSTDERPDEPDWSRLGRVVDELKSLAVTHDIPVLSVSQINRGGYVRQQQAIYGESIAGSIKKKENADFLMTINFAAKRDLDAEITKKNLAKIDSRDSDTLEEEVKDEMARIERVTKPVEVTCWVDKNRDGPANIEMKLYIDYAAYAMSYSPENLTQDFYRKGYLNALAYYYKRRKDILDGIVQPEPPGRGRSARPAF